MTWDPIAAELEDTIEAERLSSTRPGRRVRCVYCGAILAPTNRNGLACQHHYRAMRRDPNYNGGGDAA